MTVNTSHFALIDIPNPVHDAWDPYLELPADLAALELGIVVGPILADVDYVTDYSGPAGPGGVRRYRGLGDVLGAPQLTRVRADLTGLLTALLGEGEAWYLFLGGELDEALPEPVARFSGRMLEHGCGGPFTIFEVAAGDLGEYAALLGDCDRVSGLAAPADSFPALLSQLTLAVPIPTGQRYRFTSSFPVIDTAALSRVLAHGRLFFEEIDNGTRLRMITQTHASAALRLQLTTAIEALRARG